MNLLLSRCRTVCVLPETIDEEYFDYPLFFPSSIRQIFSEKHLTFKQHSDTAKNSITLKNKDATRKRSSLASPHHDILVKKFNEFTKGQQTVSADVAAAFVRMMGGAPSQQEIKLFHEQFPNHANLKQILKWKSELQYQQNNEESIELFSQAFAMFDPMGTGKLSGHQIAHILMNYGEALSETEANGILSLLGFGKNDIVDYKKFAALLLPS